ncbi:MAG TPA: cytidine deaminase [Bacteroidia bacterium]|jgi:cytidine deaminase|nr:cytidine deaminase [Bacteroidia bacterium]
MAAEKLQYVISLDVFEKGTALPAEDLKLLKEAERIAEEAYAPYSQFKVGAAVLLDNGQIITGNNQENAAYPSGICAERVALFYAAAQNKSAVIKSIAISCHSNSKDPVTPCGACRQVIAEYEQKQGKKIRLIMGFQGAKTYVAQSIENLLPFMFGGKDLKK